jgi:hypothetical protein
MATSPRSQRLRQPSANTVPRKLVPLPSPPDSLNDGDLPIIATDHAFIHIHGRTEEPAFWGRTGNNRFDAPGGDYGVLYAAETFDGAFIETFGDVSSKIVSVSSLTVRGVATISPRREWQLVDLAGAGLSQIGLDARICTDDHALSQVWSHALWSHPSKPDGIWYAARHDANERAVALFDRSTSVINVTPLSGLLDSPQDVSTARVIEKYGCSLLP